MPIPPQIIAAGITAGSSLVSGGLDAFSASSANRANAGINREMMNFNHDEAELNRQWQERMSNTAYQRQVEDMRKAGINPIAAYGSGGASSPGGSTASAPSTKSMERIPVKDMGTVTASALDAARSIREIEKTKADTDVSLETADNIRMDSVLKMMEQDMIPYKIKVLIAEALGKAASAKATEKSVPGIEADSLLKKIQADIESKNPRFWGYGRAGRDVLLPYGDTAARMIGAAKRKGVLGLD